MAGLPIFHVLPLPHRLPEQHEMHHLDYNVQVSADDREEETMVSYYLYEPTPNRYTSESQSDPDSTFFYIRKSMLYVQHFREHKLLPVH
ncbi:hypothetical protein D3C80_1638780 [compost metagenome]